jgi:cation transport ATPase
MRNRTSFNAPLICKNLDAQRYAHTEVSANYSPLLLLQLRIVNIDLPQIQAKLMYEAYFCVKPLTLGFFVFILLLFTIAYCALFIFYRNGWDAIRESKVDSNYVCSTAISVIVPARNEEANIKACLEFWNFRANSG